MSEMSSVWSGPTSTPRGDSELLPGALGGLEGATRPYACARANPSGAMREMSSVSSGFISAHAAACLALPGATDGFAGAFAEASVDGSCPVAFAPVAPVAPVATAFWPVRLPNWNASRILVIDGGPWPCAAGIVCPVPIEWSSVSASPWNGLCVARDGSSLERASVRKS